jgi:lipopolysaccharide/colanic/teichoic acid biosynthesis glycosyltransferase
MGSAPWRAVNATAKRALDVLVATVLLACAVPFLLFAWTGIKLASPGPVIYRAKRVGIGDAPFEMFKFRTMRVNSDAGSAITAPDDDRIFPFGRFLRATKIDELPQLINILKGDMSLVGPRPEDPRIVAEHYDARMRESLAVKPGVTSPGTLLYIERFRDTVSAQDATTSYVSGILREKLEADIRYLDEQNVFKDVILILRTAVVVLANAVRSPARE